MDKTLGTVTNDQLSAIGQMVSSPNRLITSQIDSQASCPNAGEPVYARLNMLDGKTTIELNLANQDCGGVDFYNPSGNRLDLAGKLSEIASSFEKP